MRSTETAPKLVTASNAIHEALAAAELTTDERAGAIRFPVLFGFAMFASTFSKNAWSGVFVSRRSVKQLLCQQSETSNPSRNEHLVVILTLSWGPPIPREGSGETHPLEMPEFPAKMRA